MEANTSDDERFIERRKLVETYERVEIPEDCKKCPHCKGRGNSSEYERGSRSLVHEPGLAAIESCMWCSGVGYVRDFGGA